MSERESIPGYLESDKEGYVLVHKRTLVANSYAFYRLAHYFAGGVEKDVTFISQRIGEEARLHAQSLTESEVERIISQAINNSQLGL